MITIEETSENIIVLKVSGYIEEGDFRRISPDIDKIIKNNKKINVLVNATGFKGWESIDSAKQHFDFIQEHHNDVDHIAVITGSLWQKIVPVIARSFVHPEIKVFSVNESDEARKWIFSR